MYIFFLLYNFLYVIKYIFFTVGSAQAGKGRHFRADSASPAATGAAATGGGSGNRSGGFAALWRGLWGVCEGG